MSIDTHSKEILRQLGADEFQAVLFALENFTKATYETSYLKHLQRVAKRVEEAMKAE